MGEKQQDHDAEQLYIHVNGCFFNRVVEGKDYMVYKDCRVDCRTSSPVPSSRLRFSGVSHAGESYGAARTQARGPRVRCCAGS